MHMKIAYVLDDTLDKPDGVQQAMIAIAEHARSRGHDVHYIVAHTERTDLQNVHSVALFFQMKFNGNSVRTPRPASSKLIKQLMDEQQFDAIHVQMPYSPLLSAKVIKAASKNTRVVGTFHILPYSSVASIGTRLLGMLLRHNAKRFTRLYAVSPPAQAFMKQSFGLDSTVLGNPVDYEYFHSYASNQRQKNTKKQIVFVGRFDERKGVRYLVEAYQQMTSRHSVTLLMCGKGPLLEEMKSYAQQHNLDIQFPGFVTEEQKARALARADVAVFPSTGGESFGIVLTEAMAAGAAITLGGNNPGYTSVLGDFPEALFDPKNTAPFARLLERCVTDEAFVARIGHAQHEFVKNFDVTVIVDELITHAYS